MQQEQQTIVQRGLVKGVVALEKERGQLGQSSRPRESEQAVSDRIAAVQSRSAWEHAADEQDWSSGLTQFSLSTWGCFPWTWLEQMNRQVRLLDDRHCFRADETRRVEAIAR